jgi:signal transduction histidine kinase
MSPTTALSDRMQVARHGLVAGVAERLSAHLVQADEYERLWHRRVQGILRRRRGELALLDQIRTLRQRILELEAQNETLASFDRIVAHELKNSLSRIIGYAEVLAQKDVGMTCEQLEHYLDVIARDGHKLSSIIDALLLLCGASAREVEVEPLDMARIVSGALERLAPMIEDYQAAVTVPATWSTALGYGPWVEEVWVNLVSNAIKYGGMPPRVELGVSPPLNAPCWVGRKGGEAHPLLGARQWPGPVARAAGTLVRALHAAPQGPGERQRAGLVDRAPDRGKAGRAGGRRKRRRTGSRKRFSL